jgi:hypothetical protein
MRPHVGEVTIVGAGLTYLMVLSWSVANVSYDVWGVMIVVPVYALLSLGALRLMFSGPFKPIATVMYWGLLVKLAGAFVRYGVAFEAYDGAIDAASYHRYANPEAGAVWSGDQSVLDVLPGGTGTEFLERFTAFVYTFTGASQLAGFVTFALLGYFGVAFFVKAAALAVPGLAQRKYAWMCVLFPSVVYWPASIGKEAVVMLGLGVGTYGIAIMFARRKWVRSVSLVAVGLGFAGLVRPHMAGIWLAGALPALVLASVLGGRSLAIAGPPKKSSRFGVIVIVALAAVALSAVGSITVRFLDPGNDDVSTSSFSDILVETQRRSAKNGSTFEPSSVASPVNWPFAVARTLTRPLPIEARSIAQALSAAELVALGGFYAISWQRLRNLPRMLFTNPYLAFSLTALFLGALAYSSFANLGILTRQKSLLFPFMLLAPCLPLWGRTRPEDSLDAPASGMGSLGDVPAAQSGHRPGSTVGAPALTTDELNDFWR